MVFLNTLNTINTLATPSAEQSVYFHSLNLSTKLKAKKRGLIPKGGMYKSAICPYGP